MPMTPQLASTATAPRRPSALRINAVPAAVPGPTPARSTPAQDWAQAEALMVQAVAQGQRAVVAELAGEIMRTPAPQALRNSLWSDLSSLTEPVALTGAGHSAAAIPPDSLWLWRKTDGSSLGLLRLRGNGLVAAEGDGDGTPVGWQLGHDGLRLLQPDGSPRVHFRVAGAVRGRRVWLGVEAGSGRVSVLSEVGCHYARLRMLDPELTGPLAGLLPPDRLADPGLPPVPVMLLAAPRTGSHLLLNLLNSSDQALIDGEVMHPSKIALFGADLPPDRKDGLDMLRASDPVRLCKVLLTRSHHVDGRNLHGIPVRGFKLFPEQSRTVLDWAMDEPAMRVIHLHRANLLAEFSSYLLAMKLGHWVGGPDSLREERVVFDRARFEAFVQMKTQYLAAIRQRLGARRGPWFEIEYSAVNQDSVQRLLSQLLGRDSGTRLNAIGLKQQLNDCVIERFANKDAVLACLRAMGTEAWAGVERLGHGVA